MENPTPVGEDTVVAIAVNKGKISQAAVKWAVENLLVGGQSVTMLHVRPEAQAFDSRGKPFVFQIYLTHELWASGGPGLSNVVDEGYTDILDMRMRENLLPLQSYCKKKNIQSDLVILEDNDMVGAIADFVLTRHIDVLVVGAGSKNGIFKRLMGQDVAAKISKKVPYFCSVYIIAKGSLLSVRSASSASQTFPGNNVNILEHEKSHHEPTVGGQLTYSGSSEYIGFDAVSSRIALLRPDLEKEVEFRSPLQNYGHSNISTGGLSESESDISFVNSDRQFYDSPFSSFSNNSSNWRSSSFESSHSDSARESMDELPRLRLELIKTKNMYGSVSTDAPDPKMLSSNMNFLNQEENQGIEKTQRSARSCAEFSSKRYDNTQWTNQKPPRPVFSSQQ